MAHAAQELDLRAGGRLGADLRRAVLLGNLDQPLTLAQQTHPGHLQLGVGRLLLGIGRLELRNLGGQLLGIALHARHVGLDGDAAAVIGTVLGHLQPAAILHLHFHALGVVVPHLELGCAGVEVAAMHDLERRGHHVLVACAGPHGLVRQGVERLEAVVAAHQAPVGVPQHEALRDGADGDVEPRVCPCRLALQRLDLGDVHRDADETGPSALARDDLTAQAHPHPASV